MTNTDDTLTALRTRALATLVTGPASDTAVQRHNAYATVEVRLPDGSTGRAKTLDVLSATLPERWMPGRTCHVSVQQGKRCDLWHVSQLS